MNDEEETPGDGYYRASAHAPFAWYKVKMNDSLTYLLGGGLVAWIIAQLAKPRVVSGAGGHGSPTPKSHGVPFASGVPFPIWPIQSSKNKRHGEVAYTDTKGKRHGNMSRAFRASRGSGARNHVGIDIYANGGDVVVAPEDGTIVADQNFLNTIPGEDAILLETKSGVLLFGEVVAESFEKFGLQEGSKVKAGQPFAIVATTSKGSHMLHFETYTHGVRHNYKWMRSKKQAPPQLRDPTAYLLRARESIKVV